MNLCLFSVSYAGLWGQKSLSLESFIAKAAKLGYQSVMLMGKRPHLSTLDASPERIAKIKQALAKAKMTCPVIGAYTDFAGFGAGEVPSMEMQVQYVENLSRIAAQVEKKPIIRIFTSYESGPLREVWDKSVAGVQECCDRAAALGVTIAVQNHHDVAVHTDALLEFLYAVDRPNCKLGFDAWSPATRGEDLYSAAKKAAPYTVITTNADYVCLPSYRYRPDRVQYEPTTAMLRAVPFGEGFINYPAYWRGLVDGGFRGICTYEMCSPLRGGGGEANLDRCARAYVAWMTKNAAELGLEPGGVR
eukprot:TRINITY_DN34974_c0_g1_i1.p2 TRINITY_DN34974_c0_g1~~TRINITY_DN34974_c0_g1_i1.p2  ORF type:complete len:304 (-),score=16.57 TRINITY_DN34974_c0_g1_i1:46-957(-)